MNAIPALLVLLSAGAAMTLAASASGDGLPDALRGRRILIVIAKSEDNAHLLRQRQMIKADAAGFGERDVAIVEIINGAGAADGQPLTSGQSKAVAKLASVSTPFGVALVGRDGGVKLKKAEAVPAEEIFGLIDSMPMRQREMKDNAR